MDLSLWTVSRGKSLDEQLKKTALINFEKIFAFTLSLGCQEKDTEASCYINIIQLFKKK